MTHVLAVDIGSSSVRARLYDERGRHVEGVEAQRKCEVTHARDGRAEFDPDRLLELTLAVIAEARLMAGHQIAAVGISSFWHGLMALDGNDRPILPVLTWRDRRALAAAEALDRRLDAEAVHARTGCPIHPSFWPAKVLWLRTERPDTFRAVRRLVSFSDYLLRRVTGELRTSLSMASGTGLLEVNERRWDEEMLDALELSPEQLPEISDAPAGWAEPWFPALGDGACSNVGVGCVTRDRAALTVGTSGAYRVLWEAERADPSAGLFLYRLDERHLVEGGSLSDGGNLYKWLGETLRLPDGWTFKDDEPPQGLTFLPLLGGERSPGWDGRARGAIAGLTLETTPAEIAQAAAEGVAYRFGEVADLLPGVREVIATGGALSESPEWVQILADVLGRSVTLSGEAETSARGAAVVTLGRLGHDADPAALGEVFEPRAERTEIHRSARERQRELYRSMT